MIIATRCDQPIPAKKAYPYLGKDSDGMIVLFTAPREGVLVVDCSGEANRIGYFSTNWTESQFPHYTGEVTLKNG